ncbi:MAG: vanadium-dependent haloperoxidase [Bacillota bacterium]
MNLTAKTIVKNVYDKKKIVKVEGMRDSKKVISVCLNHSPSKKNINLPRKWSQLSYAGEVRIPQGLDPNAGSWPLFFISRDKNGRFITLDGKLIDFEIQHPDNFNFDKELTTVKETLDDLLPQQRKIAEYWGEGPATKQWTPIIDRLLDTYNFTPAGSARVLASVQSAINDAFVVTWHYKYLWDVPRPNQLDQELVTLICTPKFPSYPSGHSVMSGVSEKILSYFFPPETQRLKELAEECSISRLYGGVHFPSDLSEGLRLGRHIGGIVADVLKHQFDKDQANVDIPVTKNLHAKLMPPPYEQVISYPPRVRTCDLPLLPENTILSE